MRVRKFFVLKNKLNVVKCSKNMIPLFSIRNPIFLFSTTQQNNDRQHSTMINPYTYQTINTKNYISNQDQLYLKIAAATKAHNEWKQYTLDKRIELVKKMVQKIIKDQKQREKLKELISSAIGKSYKNIEQEFSLIQNIYEQLIENSKQALMQRALSDEKNSNLGNSSQKIICQFESVGISLIFPYYSQPILDSLIHLIPCLISGGGALIKHSDYNNFLGDYLRKIAQDTIKVKSLVTDIFIHPSQLKQLSQFRSIKKVIYSGSQSSAKHIFQTLVSGNEKDRQNSGRFIDCNLFFGGQDAAYVDVNMFQQKQEDIKRVCQQIVKYAFYNNGQSFDCIKRLYLNFNQSDARSVQLKQKFIDFLVTETNSLVLGNPKDAQTDLGPLGIQEQVLKIESLLTDSINDDAVCIIGGITTTDGQAAGIFLEPTILINCSNDLPIVQTQVEAPILCVFNVESEEQFVEMVNDNRYGTGVRIFTKNISEESFEQQSLKSLVQKLEVGRIVFNEGSMLSRNLPIQGWKRSGKGKILSKFSYEEYTLPKVFNICE